MKSKEENTEKNLQIIRDDTLGINVVVNPQRVLDQSIKQANDELCDAYMLYKDLSRRCTIDFDNMQSNGSIGKQGQNMDDDSSQDEADNKKKHKHKEEFNSVNSKQKKKLGSKKKKQTKVFYFKPESFMMADPDTQRQFREKLINRIKAPPELSKPRLMAQDLQQQLIETVADRSNPTQMRKLLADYFKRKQYCLQHKRYKLLIRWAHHALRIKNIENLSTQATFRCSKLQWEIDNSIKRAQRLSEEDDYFLGMHPGLRPSSKSGQNEGTLYLEIKDLDPHSSIREDDIEVYLRHITYSEKINKQVNKWLAKLKWMSLSHRFEIFDRMVDKYFHIRDSNINKQFEFLQKVEKHTRSINVETQEFLEEIKLIKEQSHILNYKKQMYSIKQKTLGACRPDYDAVPDLINNNPELKQKVKEMAKLYGLTADLDQDEGFSFGYQLTLFFPTQFQMLVLRSTFSIYDAFAGQNDELSIKKQRNTQSSVRIDPNLFKDVSTNQNLNPNEESLSSESQRQNIKIVRLKSAQWLQYVNVFPRIPDWQKRQDAILSNEDNPIDHLLQGVMDFLDVNDLASVNIIIAEASQMQVEIVKKLKILDEKVKDSKLKMKVQVPSGFQKKNEQDKQNNDQNDDNQENQELAVEQEVTQTVSATSIHEMNNSLYYHMSNCLTGANLLAKIYQERQAKENAAIQNQKLQTSSEIQKTQNKLLLRTSLLNLQQNLVQSHSILRYMNSRHAKTNILYSLNYFRSIQKRLMIDLREFGTRERILGDVADPFIPPDEADINLVDTYNMVIANTNKDMKDIIEGNHDQINENQMSGAQKIQRNITKRYNQQIEKIKEIKEIELQEEIRNKIQNDNSHNKNSKLSSEQMLEAQYDLLKQSDMNAKLFNSIELTQSISLVDIKKIRYKKQFQERHLTTCPVLPRHHATFGEPSEIQPEFVQNELGQKEIIISRECMKFLNRIDHIEINEKNFEVLVKDDFNIYIMYECSITDMQILEQEMLRIGSYYISRLEELYDTEVDKISHKKDRQQVLNDLLNCEMEFQFKKVQLTELYMEIYEHNCDPVEQQRLVSIIINLMAKRPRLSLENFNFIDSYKAELYCLEKQIELLELIIESQMRIEKDVNTNLHESLNLSYKLAQMKERDQWEYNNTDDFIMHLVDKYLQNQKDLQYEEEEIKDEIISNLDETQQKWLKVEQQLVKDLKLNEISSPKKKDRPKGNRLTDIRYNDEELNGDAFTEILGLPKVTVENLFNQKSENDDIIKEIMDEQSHFVNLVEGYPDLMSLKFSGSAQQIRNNKELSCKIGQNNKVKDDDYQLNNKKSDSQNDFNAKNINSSMPSQIHDLNLKLTNFNKRSVQMSVLDFYSDSLNFAPKMNATFSNIYNELSDVLCPHDNTMSSLLEAEIYQQAILQFREVQQFLTGEKIEYQGRQYIEDDQILGSSDKMMFYMKDFYSSFQRQQKNNQNPFLVSKLDHHTIKQFHYPKNTTKQQNPYLIKKFNLKEGLEISLTIAQNMFFIDPNQFNINYVKPGLIERKQQKMNSNMQVQSPNNLQQQFDNTRKIKAPNILHLTCNMVEILRLRHELMLCISECIELQKVYINQVQTCNCPTLKPLYSEGLAFEHGLLQPNELNFIDDGPASILNIELAINECDPIMVSNLNFRNADGFKIMITKSGLEELRVILHYQMMQKQALIVSTRTNQILMDTHMRALAELQIARRNQGIPNTVIQLDKLFSRFSDDIDEVNFTRIRRQFTTNLTDCVQHIIVSVNQWKSQQRTNLSKKFQEAVAQCEQKFQVKELKLRILRSYKVSLINQYCNHVLEKVYADSIKFDIVSQCQRLRNLNQYFQFNPQSMSIQTHQSHDVKVDHDKVFTFSQLFNLETNSYIENGYDWYQYGKYVNQFDNFAKNTQIAKISSQNSESSTVSNNLILSKIDTIDIKKKQQLDIFSIPSSQNLMQIDIFFNNEEKLRYLKQTLDSFKFDFDNHNVESNYLYEQILPNIQDIYPEDLSQKNYRKDQQKIIDSKKRAEILDYSQLKIVDIFNYYKYVENIINLELSISKFSLNCQISAEMDNCIKNGIPFFQARDAQLQSTEQEELCSNDLLSIMNSGKAVQNILHTQKGKNLIQDQEKLKEDPQKRNIMASKILNEIYYKKRIKSDVGEELYYVSLRLKDILFEAKNYGQKVLGQTSFSFEYLALYQEIRYLQIVSTIQKMSDHFYNKRQIRAGKLLNDTLLSMSMRDHVQVFLQNGSAHVNTSDVDSHYLKIDTSSIVNYFGDFYESSNFKKAIFPILNDKALEPFEMTLLETIYLNNSAYQEFKFMNQNNNQKNKPQDDVSQNKSQNQLIQFNRYTGGAVLTKPFSGSELLVLQTNLLCLDNQQRLYISSNLKQMDSLLEDYLQHIVNETLCEALFNRNQKILSYQQLLKSRRFLTDQIEARQLKNAILCFLGHDIPQKLMLNSDNMDRIDRIFKKDLLWKIMQEKDLQKIAQESKYNSRIQDDEYLQLKKDIEDEIIKLQKIVERKITSEEIQNHQKLKIKALEEEHNLMRKNVLLDSILYNRAQVVVIEQEIERCLIKAAVKTLDSECVALANCLKVQSQEINAFIHPFQQFAVTLYDKIDKNSHLDPINKCSHLQVFLTRLKNRGTEVETLTSGPGYVFTLKDINDCVGSLANGLLKFSESELRSRCEFFSKKEQHYQNLLYSKDQQIEYLEYRINQQTDNIDKLVNARMYEKGNKLVYELDQSNRSLKLLKDNYNLMERNLSKEIEFQFRNKLLLRETLLFKEIKKFRQYKDEFTAILKFQLANDNEKIQQEIKKKADQFSQLDEQSPGKYLLARPNQFDKPNSFINSRNIRNQTQQIQEDKSRKNIGFINEKGQMLDDVNEPGKPYEFPSQIQQAFKMSEAEALNELAIIVEKTRLMFVFWKFKEVIMKQKFNEQLLILSQKVSSNIMLWEQMAESEKRENILKQELVLSQQTLSNSEKMIEKQREHIKKLETEVVRLQNFKQQKSKRLDELEKKVIQYEIIQKIDVDKLIFLLHKQQKEVESLKNDEKNFSSKLKYLAKKNNDELLNVQQKYNNENQVKNEAIINAEQMRQEMKLLEINNGSMTNVWKQKCQQLAQMVQQLQSENYMLKEKSQDLAQVSIKLLNTFNEIQQNQGNFVQKINTERFSTQLDKSINNFRETKSSLTHINNIAENSGQDSLKKNSRDSIRKLQLPELSNTTKDNQNKQKNQSYDIFAQQQSFQDSNKFKRRVIIPNHRRGHSLLQSQKLADNHIDSQNSLIQSNNSVYDLKPRQDNIESSANLMQKQIQRYNVINKEKEFQIQGDSAEYNKQILEKRLKNLQNLKRAISVSQQTQDISIIDSQQITQNFEQTPQRKNIQNQIVKKGFASILGGQQLGNSNDCKEKNNFNLKQYQFGQYQLNNSTVLTGKQISGSSNLIKQYPNNQKEDSKSFYNMKGLMGIPQLYKNQGLEIREQQEDKQGPKVVRDNVFKKYNPEKSNESRISQENIENLSNVISQATTVLLNTQQTKNRTRNDWIKEEQSNEMSKINSYLISDKPSIVKDPRDYDQASPDEDAQLSQYQITPIALQSRQMNLQLLNSK